VPFETPQLLLRDLLDQVDDGRIQLPDFQRPWKWEDERIASLLATVTMGYPIGVMMALETGGDTRFRPRQLEGATKGSKEPALLLMDGQQRLSSLFQALRSDAPVNTKDARKKKLRRWYYIDIARAIREDSDREEAILSVPEARILRTPESGAEMIDLSSPELEAKAGIFPLRLILDGNATQDWMFEYVRHDPARKKYWNSFRSQVLDNVVQYLVPVIKLTKSTPKEAVCMVFEKVNTGGVPLNVFELVTASWAADQSFFDEHGDDFQLHEDWEQIRLELSEQAVLVGSNIGLQNTDLLQAVTLVSTHHRRRGREGLDAYTQPAASCKRKDILELPLQEYLTWAPRVVEALYWSAQFLKRQYVFHVVDLPYSTQLVALAAIRTVLGEETDTDGAYKKICRWYWCGVFGEQYGGSPETRLPRDLEQVVAWVRGGREPASVGEALFQEARLDTMRSRTSAAYKGLYALLMQQGCKDWTHNRKAMDEQIYFDHQVDLYRIFPKDWCEKNGVGREWYDSIVNKTLLAHRTGQLVGQRSPDSYLNLLQAETGLPRNWLDDIVGTHLIDPTQLREPDFYKFYHDRASRLRGLIESAMGKSAVPATEAPETVADYEVEPESSR
jgi:hypothetical protein